MDTNQHLATVLARWAAYDAVHRVLDDARHEFERSLLEANDAGVGYRTLAEALPLSFGYVGDIVRNLRDGGDR